MKERKVKNFAGVKFTSHDLCEFGWICSEYKDEYSICYGFDEVEYFNFKVLFNVFLFYIFSKQWQASCWVPNLVLEVHLTIVQDYTQEFIKPAKMTM